MIAEILSNAQLASIVLASLSAIVALAAEIVTRSFVAPRSSDKVHAETFRRLSEAFDQQYFDRLKHEASEKALRN